MCGGGGGGGNDRAQQRRHEEQMALQREQMAEQKRQFELQLQQQQQRYEEQRAAAMAPPAPAPNPIAETSARSNPVAAPALVRAATTQAAAVGQGLSGTTAPTAAPVPPPASATDPLYAPNETAGGGMQQQQTLAIAPRAQRSGMGRRRFRTSVAGGSGGLSIPG
tara:strand:- start:1297 stop:1791 length:495 start_codon:yes stop_codon:yes gene_type:complete